jgi:flagellar protein FlaG
MEVKSVSQGGQTSLDLNHVTVDNVINAEYSQQNNSLKFDENSNNEVKRISDKDVKKAIDKLNKLFEDKATHIEYELYGRHKDMTIKIVDDVTKEVIKEVPPKKIIDMVDKLCELAGLFVDDKA